jgi:hypothetical protein
MMNYHKVGEYVTAQPFRPFRIKMVSGKSFDIRHPEMIMVGVNSAKIYTTKAEDPDGPPFWTDASLMLIETIELLEPQSAAGRN